MQEGKKPKRPSWVQRYRLWRQGLSRGQRWRMRALQAVVVVAVVFVLMLWAAYSLLVRRPEIPVPPSGIEVPVGGSMVQPGPRRDGVYTFLLVGKDTGGGGNTDTMILVAYDTEEKTVDAMSLPRDTMVNVSWNNKKLNTVYNYYKGRDKETQVEKGISALQAHVSKLTGILPDFYVIVEWDAVGELVDALGGVTFDVPYDMHYDDPDQDLHIHQEKGERKLSGEDAMEVIRWRKNNGEYGNFQIGDSGRMKVQQAFLTAVVKECLQLKHVMNIPDFAQIFSENVATNLSVGNLVWFAQQATGIDAEEDLCFRTMPYTPYTRNTAYVLPVVDELLAIVNDGLNPYRQEITADNIEVLQLNDDGSLSLTNGTLEDEALAEPRKPAQPKPKPKPPVAEEVLPEIPLPDEQPEQPVQDPTQDESGQTPEIEIQPMEPTPEIWPEEPVQEQTEPQITPNAGAQVNSLPATPVPVQQ